MREPSSRVATPPRVYVLYTSRNAFASRNSIPAQRPGSILVPALLAIHTRLLAPYGAADLAGHETRLPIQRGDVAAEPAPGHDEHRRAVSVLQRAPMVGCPIREESEPRPAEGIPV
jgi:hypothetical protein